MTRFRRFFFWIHLVAGVAAGLVIFVLSVTGAALALKPQILRVVDTSGFDIRANGRQPLSASALADAIRSQDAAADVRSVTISRDATTVATAQVGSRSVYVDPYNGNVLGEPSQPAQQVFRAIENWHRWFALQGDSRQTGRAVTGVANVTFLFLAVSGLWLWVPRQWTLRHLRPVTFFRRTSTPKARDFNWHNVAGIWSLPMIVVMTLTGVFMSYPALMGGAGKPGGPGASGGPGRPGVAEGTGRPGTPGRPGRSGMPGGTEPGAALDRSSARGSQSPELGHAQSMNGPNAHVMAGDRAAASATPAVRVDAAIVDAAVNDVQSRMPEWQKVSVEMPRSAGGSLMVSASVGSSTPASRSQLAVNAATGEVVRWQPAVTNAPLSQRVRTWIRFGHTGELWGLTGQVLAGLSCLGGALLVWTGLSLALRRLAAFMRRPTTNVARAGSRAAVPMAGYAPTIVSKEAWKAAARTANETQSINPLSRANGWLPRMPLP